MRSIQYDDILEVYNFEFALVVVAMETNMLNFINVGGPKRLYVAIATKPKGNSKLYTSRISSYWMVIRFQALPNMYIWPTPGASRGRFKRKIYTGQKDQ